MPGIEYSPMVSRHHPHHPLNRQSGRERRSTYSSVGTNNPYASHMAEAPPAYSSHYPQRPSSSESYAKGSGFGTEASWWSQSSEHQSVYPTSRSREKTYRGHSSHREDSHHEPSISGRRRRPHVRPPYTSQYVQPDLIDRLDDASFYAYHHEGPFDAASPDRNRVNKNSPIEAVKDSIEEALRATPRDKIIDTIQSHRPLDGVAFYPPGTTDREGQTYQYEEGSNMMDEYGLFMRTPGKKFTDEDFKDDPFYNQPHPNYLSNLKRKISLRRWRPRRDTA
ncbi:hypothetical protein PDE_06504 [Penicillium oxalicum 114-2]|uniref:Pal1 cell morphology n=1 Tax=Penicillium oxalicum (strain 114-2 / CGMCC 5302) TaxID=933388 RepID=S7ZMG4_PENO1|nr:hypothetical protein PDE_06504 [Penicillium oxalicum 114-2]